MIYIRLNESMNIDMIHYMPFDENYGLGKTREQLEAQGGIFVESVPEPENQSGKVSTLKYSKTDGLYYEYVDRELTTEEKLETVLMQNEALSKRLDSTENALLMMMDFNL